MPPVDSDPYLACAAGIPEPVEAALRSDPGFANRPGGLWRMPPLVAVTHSSITRLPRFSGAFVALARRLLDAGADPNASWIGTGDHPHSALYGAAGKNHHAVLCRMLLDAGADPNDGESLYHAMEEQEPGFACARMLLDAGALAAGTNALCRVLDFDRIEGLRLLLPHVADRAELTRGLIHAIRRRRSLPHIDALLDAGADPGAGYWWAHWYGLPEAAARMGSAALDPAGEFVAACARVDRETAAPLRHRLSSLSPEQLQMLPNLAQAGHGDAVRLMVTLGWPIDVTVETGRRVPSTVRFFMGMQS